MWDICRALGLDTSIIVTDNISTPVNTSEDEDGLDSRSQSPVGDTVVDASAGASLGYLNF
jgi:hypothetical protein